MYYLNSKGFPLVVIDLRHACNCVGNGDEWKEGEVVTGVEYKTPDDVLRMAHGSLTVACDGIYSTLRAKLSVPNIQSPSYFVGLVMHGCALPFPNYGHVVLGKPSPLLFYPISSTEVC